MTEDQRESRPNDAVAQVVALREDIDEIDRSLIALLESRLEVCRALGQEKMKLGLPLRDQEREQEVVAQLSQISQDEILISHLPALYHEISAACLKVQEEGQEDKEAGSTGHEIASSDHSQSDEGDLEQQLEVQPKKRRRGLLLRKRPAKGILKRQLKRIKWRGGGANSTVRGAPLTPNQRAWLTHIGFAHRGLHDALAGIPENSMPAFERAIERGYGIELDVHLSSDGVPVVFHDEELGRMTGFPGEVYDHSLAELRALKLIPGGYQIPTLEEVINLVQGRVPLLVEVKNYGQPVGKLEEAVGKILCDYTGPLCVQSFNPMSLKWFLKHHPKILRGLIAYSFPVEEVPMASTTRFLLKNLLLTPVCKPHYIAYEHNDLVRHRLRRLHRMRARGTPILVWTVRSQVEADLALMRAENIIFEGFDPRPNRPQLELDPLADTQQAVPASSQPVKDEEGDLSPTLSSSPAPSQHGEDGEQHREDGELETGDEMSVNALGKDQGDET